MAFILVSGTPVCAKNAFIGNMWSKTGVISGTYGSGKSTLLSLQAEIEIPSVGRIIIRGKGIHLMSQSQLVDFRLKDTGFIS